MGVKLVVLCNLEWRGNTVDRIGTFDDLVQRSFSVRQCDRARLKGPQEAALIVQQHTTRKHEVLVRLAPLQSR